MKVAVFGGSGTIGRALLPALASQHDVVAISRHERSDGPPGVTWAVADVEDAGSVRRALTGVDVAYYLVHSLGSAEFEEHDLRAAETVAAEAELAGARQLVYLGGLGDDRDDLSPHLRSRIETGRRLAAGSVPVTTLRAAMVVGPESAAFETIVALVDRLPAMICPSWVSTLTQPIALDDVVRYLAGVCGLDREMIERIARLRGRRPLIVEVPLLSPRLSSYWLHLVTPVNAKVARPLIEGLRNETVAREQRIRELIPFEPTRFDQAAKAALAA